ncbi:serine hydrolase domain-containing protein [Salinimicrobium sp. TH3]|uniref:serine hydrolase domain-containing protein n=1 Tax=Salinimicrobium sp. TH3 TaxID=2997342 RepID=UPI0022740BA6|nr:serine hydrolase domain-containing protein [Salinimicrobium sp. TH3]MCY2687526.1 serine hydrolase [Salinimicrobium sp. TH3]
MLHNLFHPQKYVLFLLLVTNLLSAQNPGNSGLVPATSAEEAGMSESRLEKIDQMIKEAIAQEEIPGAVALIAKDGKIVYHKSFGMANAEGEALEKDDIFRIASQTKAITSTAVMMLWEEGKFRLDDPISKYIPEFKDPQLIAAFNEKDSTYTTKPAGKEITIRQLLTHTSGLGYGRIDSDDRIRKIYTKAGIVDLFTTDKVNIEENVKKLAGLPLYATPGEEWHYSEGLDVLGYFVEVISGQPFDEFLQERIFDPLGMEDTQFYMTNEKKDRLVAVQHKDNGEWKNFPVTFYDPDYPVKGAKMFFSGGAGLTSTAEDYARFLQMYLNGGEFNGNRILSRTTVDLILKDQAKDLFGDPNKDHGLAFSVLTDEGVRAGGLGSEGTFDWGGYFNTQYFADPEEDVIGIILKQTQGDTGDETGWKFRQMVLASVAD